MQFLEINTLDDLRPHVEGKKEITVRTNDEGYTTVVYQFMDSSTFDSIPSLEARGIMFDDLDNIISRPLHKFHNLNATHSGVNSYTREYILANKDKVRQIFEKLDGSMISTANYNGEVRLRSKKAFDTDVCKLAQPIYDADVRIQEFCKLCIQNGWTATFELTHPEARIVLDYSEPQLRLLHVRDNVTGKYLDLFHDLPACPTVSLGRLEDILSEEHLVSLKDTEGYVIQFEDGDMVKIKCPWYVSLHRTVTFVRERDIAELVLDERLDDVYAAFDQLKIDTDAVAKIETTIKNELLTISKMVETLHAITQGEDRKTVALRHRDWSLFPLLMRMRDGKDLNLTDFYRKNCLKQQWSLKPVGNVGEKEL